MLKKIFFIKNLSGLHYLKDHFGGGIPKEEFGYKTEALALEDAKLLGLDRIIIEPIYIKTDK